MKLASIFLDSLFMCSTIFFDNLLVEADIFYHFRGLILCKTKHLQFHQNKKQEQRGTVQQAIYSPMSSLF